MRRLLPFLCLAAVTVVLTGIVVTWTRFGLDVLQTRALADPDAYMWLNRVLQIRESGDWFSHVYPRVGPPDGHVQHWTRPLDGLLLLGGSALGWLMGWERGLYVWGFVLAPLLHIGGLVALVWAARPLIGVGWLSAHRIPLLLLIFLVQLPVYQTFMPGRPDHHAPLALLFILYLGFWLRVMLHAHPERRAAIGLGLTGALAIWVNVEALIFVALGMTGMGLLWLSGDRAVARKAAVHAGTMALGLVVALPLEWGTPPYPMREMDTLAVAHILLLGLAAVFWTLLQVLTPRLAARPLAPRLGVALVAAVGVLAVLYALVPEFFRSPFAGVDPLYSETRLQHIIEFQPLTAWSDGVLRSFGAVVLFCGTALVGLPYALLRTVRSGDSRGRVVWFTFALLAGVYLFMAIREVRWTDYLALTALLPYAVFGASVLARIESRLNARALRLGRPGATLLIVLGPTLVGLVLHAGPVAPGAQQEVPAMDAPDPGGWGAMHEQATLTLDGNALSDGGGGCELRLISEVLADERWFSEPTVVLAHTDYGPELLYRTRHSVLSIPNHRHQPGYTFTHEVLSHPDPGIAAGMLRERGVGIIVLCRSDVTSGFFRYSDVASPFVETLALGQPPEGYALHAAPDGVRIYRRVGDGSDTGATGRGSEASAAASSR